MDTKRAKIIELNWGYDMHNIREAQLELATDLTELLQAANDLHAKSPNMYNDFAARKVSASIVNTLQCMLGLERKFTQMANGTYRESDPDAYERKYNIQ